MIDFIDRIPDQGLANRKRIKYADGRIEYAVIENADNPVHTGTSLNRDTFMKMQGFQHGDIRFKDGKIIESNIDGYDLITTFEDGKIIETFYGEKTIRKETYETSLGITIAIKGVDE